MKTLIPALLILFTNVCKSQDYKNLYYLDGNLSSVSKSNATIIGKGLKADGAFRLDCFAIKGGNLFMSMHFTDSSLADVHGLFSSYHLNGNPERTGVYVHGKEDGYWKQWDSAGRLVDSTFYKLGKPMVTTTYRYNNKGHLSYYTNTDSLAHTFETTSYDEEGKVTSKVLFKDEQGEVTTYTPAGITKDSVFTRAEVEATFPGGEAGWRKYLQHSLDANIPAEHNAPEGTYMVVVRFIVRPDGSISDVAAETDFRFGMEQEAIRVIKSGPKWIPAIQYGRKVSAYRRQPITFALSVQ